jgi:hypothetical protein
MWTGVALCSNYHEPEIYAEVLAFLKKEKWCSASSHSDTLLQICLAGLMSCQNDLFILEKHDGKLFTCHFYFLRNALMVFCYQNCSDLLWDKIVIVIEKNFENLRLKAENLQNWTIYSNSERSEQFLVTECFFNLFL